jgi:hypothetical protein
LGAVLINKGMLHLVIPSDNLFNVKGEIKDIVEIPAKKNSTCHSYKTDGLCVIQG